MRGIRAHLGKGHLMGTERPLHGFSVHDLRSRPSLWRPQNDRRPARPALKARRAGLGLNATDLGQGLIERRGHELMHFPRVVAGDDQRLIATPAQVILELRGVDAS